MLSSAGQLRRDEGDDLPRFYRTPVAARRERALKLRSQYLCLATAVAASKICNPHLKALGRFRRSDNQNLAGPTCLVQRLPGLVVDLRTGRTGPTRSEEHTSELQSLMRNSYAVFCLKKKQ